jgi:uncharacterized damage-inducible protein DinB
MAETRDSATRTTTRKMAHYMAWANAGILGTVAELPEEERLKTRQTLFRNITHTVNHIYVIEDIFRAHLEGRGHDYTARNTEDPLPFDELRAKLTETDRYYTTLADTLSDDALNETINFTFVGGGDGAMTRLEILLHLATHSAFHRGFVNDMLFQVPTRGKAFDLTVFLRDVWPGIAAART